MSIYRGTGSASTTTDQATIDEVTTQATNAASSATSAASSASSAASSASSASSSASTATTKASEASASASSASSSASTATTKANEASSSATNAAASATTASSHATNSETSKDAAVVAQGLAEDAQLAAETAKGLAEGFKDLAATSASSASASASTATTKAGEALASANSASNAQTAAEAAQAAAEAAQAAIDGTYLGAQASNPTGDGNGNDVTVGDWYFNTTANQAYIYNGSTWDALAPDLIGDTTPQLGGNLDLNSNDITGTGNINVTGSVTADGLTVDGNIKLDGNGRLLQVDKNVSGTDNVLYYDNTVSTNDLYVGRDSSNLRLRTNGQNRLLIDSDGDLSLYEDTGTTAKFFWDASAESLGIGTQNPAYPLEVAGSFPSISILDTDTTNDRFRILHNGGSSQIQVDPNNVSASSSLLFSIDGSEKVRLDASGNVGIGTSSPDAPLTVQGGSATAATIQLKGGALANDNASIHSLYNLYLKADSSESISGRNMIFQVGSSPTMRLDSSGNLGLGVQPTSKLNIASTQTNDYLRINGPSSRSYFGYESGNTVIYAQDGSAGASNLIFATGSSPAMRIDTSGNLLVGTTDGSGFTTSSTNSGVKISDGIIAVNGAGGSTAAGYFNVFDDGTILDFRKDGASVGSIASKAGTNIIVGTGNCALSFQTGTVRPRTTSDGTSDGVNDLGTSDSRFKDLYLSGNSIINNRTYVTSGAIYDASGTGNNVGLFFGGGQVIGPRNGFGALDNAVYLGSSTYRFKDLYLSNNIYQGGFGLTISGSTLSVRATSSSHNVFIQSKDPSGTLKGAGTDGGNSWAWRPTDDNLQDLGMPSKRWDDVRATNGTIQTSDRNEKQDIEELSDAEQRVAVVAKGLLRKYRWINSVEEKGDDARIHFGIIAQDLEDAFTAEGLDAGRYGMFIYDKWWEAEVTIPAVEEETDEDGNVITQAEPERTEIEVYSNEADAPEGAVYKERRGIRYNQLLAFIIAAI